MPDRANPSDRLARNAWLRALQATAALGDSPTLTLPVVIERIAAASPDAPALIGETAALSYRQLAAGIDAYAGWALRHGIGRGDMVCLVMHNCPEYLAIWLGISRVGGVVALLNTHQTGAALTHAIDTVAPKHLIAGAGLAEPVMAVRPALRSAPAIWTHGADHAGARRIEREIDEHKQPSGSAAGYPAPTLADRALCIYTSGTTGLPKAANVSHFRVMQWSRWFAGMMDAQPSDRMYNCLPMYHSVGGVVATGAMLVSGGSVVIRERFSASRFWDDIAASECTVFQYIGELCRYLVNAPPHPREHAHRLRLSCGNGLRADVWGEFRRRFAIPRNLEFYAATEANFSLFNGEDEPGSIGRIPPFLSHRFPVALVRFDVETGEPVRNRDGLCMRCAPDETGEAISRITDRGANGGSPFEGYTDRGASARKVLRDVFEPGDAWFRSGDLMRKDARGFYYFVDRIGDTFRWKGENVSTGEVAEAITACPGVSEAVVYGVAVPGADGRAGMATIVAGDGFDFAALRRHLAAALPEYARPVFVRVRAALDVTETFKQKKQDLVREGFDPAATGDAIYIDDRAAGAFVRIDPALHLRIIAGEVRL
ncbi:MAG TPA: long-chain-acyl-CoA synthetase [Stellaceae bacterium]|nr:long-chain-acyl-CoA synthetase [Stellaceae bacterium]